MGVKRDGFQFVIDNKLLYHHSITINLKWDIPYNYIRVYIHSFQHEPTQRRDR